MFCRGKYIIRNITKYQRNIKYISTITCSRQIKATIAAGANTNLLQLQRYCSSQKPTQHIVDSVLDHATYERVCNETMDGLNDYFEELLESVDTIPGSDIAYSDGVLTVKLGSEHGTYVINRQTPNRQIWLSSPTTGPKRYDFVGPATGESGKWVYRHTGQSLHELLQHELQMIFKEQKVEFEDLPYGR
ncbi:frataxin homolog, mitochondrial [Lucilia cuprina]|uniref:frataxin homolog, mitochondrial n=1 Tax=Lucilia cuprina TaxID=7375 RepID=UPI001F05388C|nr:frataxin homolog, mitochondrial [Lucilia cuprina]